jgi:hypothetical protein
LPTIQCGFFAAQIRAFGKDFTKISNAFFAILLTVLANNCVCGKSIVNNINKESFVSLAIVPWQGMRLYEVIAPYLPATEAA